MFNVKCKFSSIPHYEKIIFCFVCDWVQNECQEIYTYRQWKDPNVTPYFCFLKFFKIIWYIRLPVSINGIKIIVKLFPHFIEWLTMRWISSNLSGNKNNSMDNCLLRFICFSSDAFHLMLSIWCFPSDAFHLMLSIWCNTSIQSVDPLQEHCFKNINADFIRNFPDFRWNSFTNLNYRLWRRFLRCASKKVRGR
jgi:hypothetical protein